MELNDLNQDSNSYPEDLKYSEENWQSALVGIEAYERKKRRGIIWGFSALALLLGVAAGFLIFDGAPAGSANDNEVVESENSTNKPEDTASKNTTDLEEKTIDKEFDQSEKVSSKSKEQTANPIASEEPSNTIDSDDDVEKAENLQEEDQERLANNPDKAPLPETPNPEKAPVSDNLTNAPRQAPSKTSENKILNTPVPTKPAKSAISDSFVQSPTNDTSNSENLAINSESEMETDVALNRVALPSTISMNKLESLPLNADLLYGSLAQRDFEYEEIDFSKDHLYVKAGTAPWSDFGMNIFSLKDFTLGLAYERKLSSKWRVFTGVDYYMVNDLTQKITRTEIQYVYGYDSTVTTLFTDRLHYFSVPVGASYQLNSKMAASFALGASYMFWTENTLNVRRTTYEEGESISNQESSGYVDSFKRFNMFAQAGATYKLSSKFYVGVDFQFGLTDITPNEIYLNNNFDRNSRAVVYLKRLIW